MYRILSLGLNSAFPPRTAERAVLEQGAELRLLSTGIYLESFGAQEQPNSTGAVVLILICCLPSWTSASLHVLEVLPSRQGWVGQCWGHSSLTLLIRCKLAWLWFTTLLTLSGCLLISWVLFCSSSSRPLQWMRKPGCATALGITSWKPSSAQGVLFGCSSFSLVQKGPGMPLWRSLDSSYMLHFLKLHSCLQVQKPWIPWNRARRALALNRLWICTGSRYWMHCTSSWLLCEWGGSAPETLPGALFFGGMWQSHECPSRQWGQ